MLSLFGNNSKGDLSFPFLKPHEKSCLLVQDCKNNKDCIIAFPFTRFLLIINFFCGADIVNYCTSCGAQVRRYSMTLCQMTEVIFSCIQGEGIGHCTPAFQITGNFYLNNWLLFSLWGPDNNFLFQLKVPECLLRSQHDVVWEGPEEDEEASNLGHKHFLGSSCRLSAGRR